MSSITAIWSDDATEDEYLDALQELVNNGQAWRLEGAVGRAANDALEAKLIGLGEQPHFDYWGNRVPSRYEVVEGTKGHAEYARF